MHMLHAHACDRLQADSTVAQTAAFNTCSPSLMVYVVLLVLQIRSNSCCTAALEGSEFSAAFAANSDWLPAKTTANPANSRGTTARFFFMAGMA
jgi:hypothetical protein